jgi:phage/plasmid-like protein (TIGR03299 family)
MSADIETMAYAGAKPWHNFGKSVSNDLTPDEMAQEAEIAWTIGKYPVYQLWNGAYIEVPNRFNLTRESDGRVLDIVGKIYKPVQPAEAMGFFTDFVKSGNMKMETAGSLDNGRRIWGLAALQSSFTLAGGDKVHGYLLLCSPNIQGESFTIKLTPIRVVCANTLAMALGHKAIGNGATFRMGHGKAFDAEMQDKAREVLGLAKANFAAFGEQAEFLAATQVRSEQVLIDYVGALSGSKVLDSIVDAEGNGNVLDAILDATAADQTVQELHRNLRYTDLNKAGKVILDAIIDSPGSDLPSAKGTYWGAVNGVTYAVDHKMGSSEDSRLTNAWFGQRAALKQKALDLAVEYAKDSLVAA